MVLLINSEEMASFNVMLCSRFAGVIRFQVKIKPSFFGSNYKTQAPDILIQTSNEPDVLAR